MVAAVPYIMYMTHDARRIAWSPNSYTHTDKKRLTNVLASNLYSAVKMMKRVLSTISLLVSIWMLNTHKPRVVAALMRVLRRISSSILCGLPRIL